MAKNNKTNEPDLPAPDFRDVTKEEVAAARAAMSGGKQEPLKVPESARVSSDDEGTQYSRWSEQAVVLQAYRTVTKKSKLLDVVVISKIRQSKENSGSKVWSHFYMNMGDDVSEGHEIMNNISLGALTSLLVATGFMPPGGGLKASLLNKMFPRKNDPGQSSPLNNKPVIVNIVQENGFDRDQKTGKIRTDEDGEKMRVRRDRGESFLPVAKEASEETEESEE